ncbi:hypothetical protein, partial [Pseudomonas sp. N8]|uniref:hypothetical protein n=1 Tax=Pseudomonas sp. N8 TaxID=3449428 RepID=UPI003F69CB57
SLLAKAVGQLASILIVPPSSRAGSLPQWFCAECSAHHTPAPEWERSSSNSPFFSFPATTKTLVSQIFPRQHNRLDI